MSQRALLLFGLLCVSSAAFAQAYRWVDENGVVHYSDRPRPGAERIVLPETTATARLAVPTPAASRAEPAGDATDTEDQGYERLEVASPGAEETLWNIGGTLDVRLSLQPALKPGHRVRVYFDGEPRMVAGTSFTIPEVFRGVHNIQAEVLDQSGQMVIRSRTNRFYVQQTSVLPNTPGIARPR